MLTDQLLNEIEGGQGETLLRAARRLPRTRQDRPVSIGCLVRWIKEGVQGRNGERIKLEAARLGGRWITTPPAIRRFVAAQTPALDSPIPAPTPAPQTPRARTKASERAARDLEQLGI